MLLCMVDATLYATCRFNASHHFVRLPLLLLLLLLLELLMLLTLLLSLLLPSVVMETRPGFVQYLIFFLTIPIDRGFPLTMLSRGQTMLLNVGETAVLDCRFRFPHFSLFQNPITWTKTVSDRDVAINIMGNILERFNASKRYAISNNFFRGGSYYNFHLSIANVTKEDSGKYKCKLSGSSLKGPPGFVTLLMYTLDVREPILRSSLTMLSRGQTMLLNVGETAVFDCRFRLAYFDIIDDKVTWRKIEADGKVVMNVLGFFVDRFCGSKRHTVVSIMSDILRNAQNYNYQMSIANVTQEDSGKYRCKVEGRDIVPAGLVTYTLDVRENDTKRSHDALPDVGNGSGDE